MVPMANWVSQRRGALVINGIPLGTLAGLGWDCPCPCCSSSKGETRKSCKGSLNMNCSGLSSLKVLKQSEGFPDVCCVAQSWIKNVIAQFFEGCVSVFSGVTPRKSSSWIYISSLLEVKEIIFL